ncbi:MAG: ATP-binding protein, partial [Dialister invisus]|nr:ATP-binding protein [Dialister invisus]
MNQFLTHVYGQEKLKRELKLLMENHRLPHTMIFYGDDGLGKTTAAFDFADFLTGASEKIWVEIKKIKSSKNEKLLENLKGDRVWYIRPMGMELKIDQFRAFMEEMASFDEKLRVCIIDD